MTPKADAAGVSGFDPSRVIVLIADDEVDNTDTYRRALRGYKLLVAQRGDQALALLAEHGVDIVVTDQRMPGATGARLLERVRAVNPIARRVIVSAHAEADHLLEAINRGEVERYLVKPIAGDTLRREVDILAVDYLALCGERARVAQLEDQLSRLRRQLAISAGSVDGWERLELELARARRFTRNLAFIVVENCEHLRGEFVATVREIDLVVPVGRKLVVALPETNRSGAEVTRDRLARLFSVGAYTVGSFPADGNDVASVLAAAR